MALKVAEVLIKWRGEGAQQVEADTKRMGSALTDLGSKAKAAGAVLSAGITAPLLLIGKQAIDAASDLNESMSAVTTVFGGTADQVMNFSRTAATQLGQSRQAALGSAAALGALFKGVGLGEQQMADFSGTLLTAAADLGSFYNVDPGTALEKLRSGLVGEAEGLRQFGILLNESAVEAKGLELGLADANGELSEGAKVQARYALIMDQIGSAQGDFARTSDGLANSQRILSARMQDVTAEIGQKLLPYALKAAQAFSGLLDWFSGLSDKAKGLAVAIGAVAAAAGPVLIIAGQLVSAIGALGPVLGILTGPIGLVVAAVVGLGIAFKENWFGIRDLVTGIVDRIGNTLGRMITFFTRAKERGLNPFRLALRTLIVTLGEKLGPDHPFVKFLQQVLRFGERLKTAFDAEGFSGVIDEIVKSVGKVDWDGIKTTLTTQGGEIVGSLLHGMQDFWNNTLSPWIHTVLDGVPGLLMTAGTWLVAAGGELIGGLLHGIQDFWNNSLSPWLHGVLDGIPGLFDAAGTWLTTDGAEIVTGLLHGLQDFWNNNLGPWLRGVINGIPGLFDAAGEWLSGPGTDIVSGLLHGMQDFWNNHLSVWLREVISGLPGLFAAAYEWLQEPGSKLIDGLRHGAQDLWNNNVLPWLQGLPETIKGLLTGAYDWLQEPGSQLIDGLRHGAQDFWNNTAGPWVQGLPQTIKDIFLEAGGWLVDAGKAVIQGLVDGIGADKDAILNAIMALVPTDIEIAGQKVHIRDDPTATKPPKDDGSGGGGGEFRAMGGPLGKRFTMVGEYGPELLINRSLVMPHGAAQSRVQAMGGMAYGGTGSLAAITARATAKHNQNSDAYNRAAAYGDRTGDYSRLERIKAREARTGDRALLNHSRNSDALNRANDYGDRSGDYGRRDRVLAREARNGTLQSGGLSRQEKQYMIVNHGTINVKASDSNVARAIGDELSSRNR